MGYPVGILETHSSDAVCKLWNSGWKRTNLKTPGVLNPTRADEHCPRRWFLVPLSPRASNSCEPLYQRALVSSEVKRDPRLWNQSNHYNEPRPSLPWICSRKDCNGSLVLSFKETQKRTSQPKLVEIGKKHVLVIPLELSFPRFGGERNSDRWPDQTGGRIWDGRWRRASLEREAPLPLVCS
ncbi:hypothetical protein RHGRI_007541 [Rhododendron griersonianum]|uniref:Uncharacterized protein n=1 Tax=Rhododendron griersonianum TaxID=479676 RepID=A0AAV6KYY7_9ERIC|nr:hypothetical protein RHGRI_007541 [Rhododendron griersonianum]